MDWAEPDWNLLRTRVDAELIVSVADWPGLGMPELQRSWFPLKDRGLLHCAPRAQARLTALSVAAEGWLKHNGHVGLDDWLQAPWGGDEPLADLIREEGRDAADVILERMTQVLSDEPHGTIADLYAQRYWPPGWVHGQESIIRGRFDPAAAPVSLFGLADR
ncbi:MAG: hypothetical protein V4755_14895, partial [Curtobacterium sp.]